MTQARKGPGAANPGQFANADKSRGSTGQVEVVTEPESTRVEFENGAVEWRTPEGVLHRTGGPAAETENGLVKAWMKDGELHRIDGPALVWGDGDSDGGGGESWWREGLKHRIGGPAEKRRGGLASGGDEEHWFEGKRHRIDGPAVQRDGGARCGGVDEYWVEGKRHRIDGPAVHWRFKKEEYWLDGVHFPTRKAWEEAKAGV